MARTGSRWMAVGCAWALAFWSGRAWSAESDQLLATVNEPATVTAAPAASSADTAARSAQRPHVIVSVTGYHPTDNGTPVEVVVKGRTGDGQEREVGRFGITPDVEFDAANPSDALRFNLALPRELATKDPVKFSVHLVPTTSGQAKGASLRVGGVEIR